jgi:uncharacterized protein
VESDSKVIVNLMRGNIICERVAIAHRRLGRIRGLAGRDSLPAEEGFLLQPAHSLRAAFARFPIDIVFLDEDLRVVELVEGLRPWRAARAAGAQAALGLSQGQIANRRIEVGDQLGVLSRPGSASIEATPEPSSAGGSTSTGDHRQALRVIQGGRRSDAMAATPGSSASASDAIRVLLVATDRRFRSVAAALLTRRGCTVAASERASDVAALAKRECVDVVVLDAGGSLTVAAREAAQIERLEFPVGVVVVDEQESDDLSTMPVLAKWGSFDALFEAIELACPTHKSRLSNVEP